MDIQAHSRIDSASTFLLIVKYVWDHCPTDESSFQRDLNFPQSLSQFCLVFPDIYLNPWYPLLFPGSQSLKKKNNPRP
jgi:hypothetical protein